MSAVPRPEATIRDPAAADSVFGRMADLLDVRLDSEIDAVRLVEQGVASRSYRRLVRKLKIPAALVAPESTVRRRLLADARFSEAESERLVRIARVYAEAVELFGDEDTALDWLRRPAAYIPDHAPVAPIELAAKDSGARLIESHLRRTAHGIF